MRKAFCLVFIPSLYILILSCGEEIEPEPAPMVLSVNVRDGWEIPSNAIITVTFSEEMDTESAIISLNGVPVSTTSDDGKTFSFSAAGEGEAILTITGKSMAGQMLDPPYKPITLTVTGLDTIPPEMVGDECDPENGSDNIHTFLDYSELYVTFSEPMSEVKIISKSPDFPSREKLSDDGRTLTISLDNFSLPNETEFVIILDGTNLAGTAWEKSGIHSGQRQWRDATQVWC